MESVIVVFEAIINIADNNYIKNLPIAFIVVLDTIVIMHEHFITTIIVVVLFIE